MTDLDYRPISLKDLLVEMKDVSELMVDLAYSAILFESCDIASEVVTLEESMNQMVYHARIQSMLGARRLEEAEAMSGLLQVAEAAEKISNTASDTAQLVLKNYPFPAHLKKAMPEAEEVTVRCVVQQGSAIDGRALGAIKLQSTTGMRVIAIRRGSSWIFDPDRDTGVVGGDILIAKGPQSGEEKLFEVCGSGTGEEESYVVRRSHLVEMGDLDRAAALMVEMKNISELSVGLAYTSLLFENKDIAREVVSLDRKMEEMRYRLDLWVLKAARKVPEVEALRTMLYLSSFADSIASAARSIVDVVLRDIEIPALVKKIIRESDEIITRVRVQAGSPLEGKTLKEVMLGTRTGMVVLAIKGGRRWIYRPGKNVRLHAEDVIIAKGRRDGECRLYELAGAAKYEQVSEE
ncbi:MAG: potassium channel family protein [Methanoculleaceae archaeon]